MSEQERLEGFKREYAALCAKYGVRLELIAGGGNFVLVEPALGYLLDPHWQDSRPVQEAEEQAETARGGMNGRGKA